MDSVACEFKDVSKAFPGVQALSHITFAVQQGQVHGLVGENGAGKSTLMKILSGHYADYEGAVLIDGAQVQFKSEWDALKKGISIVAQELQPVEERSVAENIFLGEEPLSKVPFVIDHKKRNEETKKLLALMNLAIAPKTKMNELSVAQKQLVEILRAISRGNRIIILDEPTSSLSPSETQFLFERIRELKQRGISIIFISHKLDEVYAICDTVTVLRDGCLIGTAKTEDVNQDELVSMMVGRRLGKQYPPRNAYAPDEVVLHVEGLCNKKCDHVSFDIHKGEILGFAGMVGAGRSEIARAIFGLDPYKEAVIEVGGKCVQIKSPRQAISHGIAMVTEDRAQYGFVGERSILDNFSLPNMDKYSRFQMIRRKLLYADCDRVCRSISVKAPSWLAHVKNLSGGNQQKVVLSKWLVRDIHVLILDEPTRGIDVGAKQEFYSIISDLARQGMGILLISSEMSEVLSLSHTVCIVNNGRIIDRLDSKTATQELVMKIIVENKGA